MQLNRLHGVGLVLGAAVLWGTTGTAQSFAPAQLSSFWVGSLRLAVASLFFVFWLLVSARQDLGMHSLRRLPWPGIVLAALSMAVYNLAFFAGIRATSVAIGTAIALGSGPVWAGLLQGLLTRRLPPALWWLGVLIAVCGLGLAMWGSGGRLRLTPDGLALCLLSGFCYAVYALTTKTLVSQASAGIVTGAVFTLAALMAVPLAAVLAGMPTLAATDLWLLVWLGVVSTGVAYLLFSVGLRYISSATGVALALGEPVAAVCLAVLVVGERPGGIAFAGLAAVLLGLLVLIRSELRR